LSHVRKIKDIHKMDGNVQIQEAEKMSYELLKINQNDSLFDRFVSIRRNKISSGDLYLALEVFKIMDKRDLLTAECNFLIGVEKRDPSFLNEALKIIKTLPNDELVKAFSNEIAMSLYQIDEGRGRDLNSG